MHFSSLPCVPSVDTHLRLVNVYINEGY